MMADRAKCLAIRSPREWRDWLEANHAKEMEARLTIHKKRSSKPGLRLGEAVEEALCFGWIDSLMRRLDEDTFALRFSPRRPGAVWSPANKRRVKRLTAEGRMTAAGTAAVRRAVKSGEWREASRREDVSRLQEDLQKALAHNPPARRGFDRMAPSLKKQYLWWIAGARKPETRRRILAAVRRAKEKS
jgi:uncharacterized protein YdeI (YjbR/CyaY-like superfamily)